MQVFSWRDHAQIFAYWPQVNPDPKSVQEGSSFRVWEQRIEVPRYVAYEVRVAVVSRSSMK
jgi:hypothetical protein